MSPYLFYALYSYVKLGITFVEIGKLFIYYFEIILKNTS